MVKEGFPERMRCKQDLTQVRQGAGAGRGHEGVTLRQRGLGVNKEPRHWSRVSVTKGRGEKCENNGVTTVSQNRYCPYSQGIDISCGWEERIK